MVKQLLHSTQLTCAVAGLQQVGGPVSDLVLHLNLLLQLADGWVLGGGSGS